MNQLMKLSLRICFWVASFLSRDLVSVLLHQNAKLYMSIKKKWSNERYAEWEKLRLRAQYESHFLEELYILLMQVYYLREYHYDYDKYVVAEDRIHALYEILSEPVSMFKAYYDSHYLRSGGAVFHAFEFLYLHVWQYSFDFFADYFLYHMDSHSGLVCTKAHSRIMSLGGLDHDKAVRSCFTEGVLYTICGKKKLVNHCYDHGYRIAKKNDDRLYEFIALGRKMSIVIASRLADTGEDNLESIETVEALRKFCEAENGDINKTAERLKAEEVRKLQQAPANMRTYYELRINDLCEVQQFLINSIAALSGELGNESVEQWKDASNQNYGTEADGVTIEQLNDLLQRYVENSYHKEFQDLSEHANGVFTTHVFTDHVEEKTGLIQLDFPDGIKPLDKFNAYKEHIQQLILTGYFDAAEQLIKDFFDFANVVKSDMMCTVGLRLRAYLESRKGKPEEAMKWYHLALSQNEKNRYRTALVDLNPQLDDVIYNEMALLLRQTSPKESLSMFDQLVDKMEQHDANAYSKALVRLQRMEVADSLLLTERVEADGFAVLQYAIDETRQRLMFMESECRKNYWIRILCIVHQTLKFVKAESSPCFRNQAYQAALVCKGFLLNAEHAVARCVEEEHDLQEFKQVYDQIRDKEFETVEKGLILSPVMVCQNFFATIQFTNAVNKVIDRHYSFLNEDLSTIQSYLKEKEVVVDFFDFDLPGNDKQYIAFIVRSGEQSVQVVSVCRESELQVIFNKALSSGQHALSALYDTHYSYAYELVAKVWNPVAESHLSSDETVYMVPSGSLAKIAIESLPASPMGFDVVAEHYAGFIRLSHSREIAKLNIADDFQNIMLFGGLDYGTPSSESGQERGYQLNHIDSLPTPLSSWSPLSGTLNEVQQIADLWQEYTGKSAQLYTGLEGSLEQFHQMSGHSPQILHIATHGFCETSESAVLLPPLRGKSHPLDLTGIVLSKGNQGWLQGDGQQHEGILMASEVAKMDLSKTQLVVLSACHTGDGMVFSDGIYGLQRAFKNAGAKSIMMSLWNEYDAAGYEMMKIFYQYLLGEKLSRHEAFKRAKKFMRNRYDDPAYWAGFIMLD